MTTTTPGCDFAFNPHPPMSAVTGSGRKFVGRYTSSLAVNDTNGKNLIPSELKAIRNVGLDLIIFGEESAGYLKGGKRAGAALGSHWAAVSKALGMDGAPLFLAADWDATPGDQAAINDALDGCADVIGRDRTGLYGGYWPCVRAAKAGKARYLCQTIAWSGTNIPGGHGDLGGFTRNVFQGLQVTVGGVKVDPLTAFTDDYGQWPRPKAPAPAPPPGQPPAVPTPYQLGGFEGLRAFAHNHGMSVQQVLWLSARQKDAGFGKEQGGYISGGNWDDFVPAGSVWWAGPTP